MQGDNLYHVRKNYVNNPLTEDSLPENPLSLFHEWMTQAFDKNI